MLVLKQLQKLLLNFVPKKTWIFQVLFSLFITNICSVSAPFAPSVSTVKISPDHHRYILEMLESASTALGRLQSLRFRKDFAIIEKNLLEISSVISKWKKKLTEGIVRLSKDDIEEINAAVLKAQNFQLPLPSTYSSHPEKIFPCIISNEWATKKQLPPDIKDSIYKKLEECLNTFSTFEKLCSLLEKKKFAFFDKNKREKNWEMLKKIWSWNNRFQSQDVSSLTKEEVQELNTIGITAKNFAKIDIPDLDQKKRIFIRDKASKIKKSKSHSVENQYSSDGGIETIREILYTVSHDTTDSFNNNLSPIVEKIAWKKSLVLILLDAIFLRKASIIWNEMKSYRKRARGYYRQALKTHFTSKEKGLFKKYVDPLLVGAGTCAALWTPAFCFQTARTLLSPSTA